MKKLTVLLVLILIAVLPVSRAEDLSALDDLELMILHQEVLDELARRGKTGMSARSRCLRKWTGTTAGTRSGTVCRSG